MNDPLGEMTFAVMTRRQYDERYLRLQESHQQYVSRALSTYETVSNCQSIEELRAWMDAVSAVLNTDLGVGAIHDGVVIREVDGNRVPADVIEPKGPGPHPILVYFHGGGWVIGASRDYRQLSLRFAEAGFLVVNVDFRCAPESQFPGPFDDCRAAVSWAAEVAQEYGGDRMRMAVAGDSSGANLAAAVAVTLADEPDAPRISAAALLYGLYDMSQIQPEEAFMRDAYLGENSDLLMADPRVSPIRAANKLPPSIVVVGSADESQSESVRLAEALDVAGITYEYLVVPGMPHAFACMEFLPEARQTIDQVAQFLHMQLDTWPAVRDAPGPDTGTESRE